MNQQTDNTDAKDMVREALESKVPFAAINCAEAIEVINKYLVDHKDLQRNDEVAFHWAIVALQNVRDRAVKAAITDIGLLFWAEVLGATHSKCVDCAGGFCTRQCGDPDSIEIADDCGYCYWQRGEQVSAPWAICIKTEMPHESPLMPEFQE